MKKLLLVLVFLVGIIGCSKDKVVGNHTAIEDDIAKVDEIGFTGEVDWIKNFGGSGDETFQAVIATLDGGYAMLGYSNSIDGDLIGKTSAVNDYWLLKLNASGDIQWSKTYGGSKDDRGQSLVQTIDGGFALTGYAMSDDGDGSNNEGFHDNWVLKLDAQGNIQWEKSFGFSGHDHSYDILQTSDNGFFFVGFLDITAARDDGYTEKGGLLTRHGVGEFWGTKINEEGELQWRGYFGGSNNDRAHAVVRADDGGYVMAGFTESEDFDISNSRGSYDFWVVKIDESGNLLWEHSFGGSGIEIAQDIANTADGGYVITGSTFSTDLDVTNNKGESDIWLIKIDDIGNLVWQKTFGGTAFDAAESVLLSKDGGFILSGNSKSNSMDANTNAGENDIWVIKTDAEGNLVWQKTFGGTGFEYGFDAIETSDNTILLVGETTSTDFLNLQNKGMSDAVVIKIK